MRTLLSGVVAPTAEDAAQFVHQGVGAQADPVRIRPLGDSDDRYGSDPVGAPNRLSALVDTTTTRAPDADVLVATNIPIRFADQTVRTFDAAIVRAEAAAGKKVSTTFGFIASGAGTAAVGAATCAAP